MLQTILNFQFSTFNFLAMGTAPAGEDPMKSMLRTLGLFVPMILVFYLVLIRPQQKQQKELKKMLEAIKTGDRVVTSGGIFGIVSSVKDKSVVVKIAENTKIEMLRSGIQQVILEDSKEEKKS
jgi:preprotein translocase subunit YajC